MPTEAEAKEKHFKERKADRGGGGRELVIPREGTDLSRGGRNHLMDFR